jgi:phosphotransferase system  glucose/maltose/N-acetylglucosamine-specific IIC component
MAINFAVRGIIALLSGLIFLVMNLFNLQGDLYLSTTVYTYSQVPINIASLLLISPISSIMLTLLYFNQRYSSEDYDLKLKLARLKNSQKGEQN